MPRLIEEPVTSAHNSPTAETVTTHPAFAQISASRVSGHTALYDSDFVHSHYMTIRIAKSQLMRGLNRDWHYSGLHGDLVQVALSEAQWATFVSSPNQSSVPCTLKVFDGKVVPSLPDPKKRTDQFAAEIKKDMADCIAALDGALAQIAALGLSKAKTEKLTEALKDTRSLLSSRLLFAAGQFDEHMETTVEKAKAEVHGYMVSAIQRAGLDALTGGALPLLIADEIEGEKKDD